MHLSPPLLYELTAFEKIHVGKFSLSVGVWLCSLSGGNIELSSGGIVLVFESHSLIQI
jgi:hypothetical protein